MRVILFFLSLNVMERKQLLLVLVSLDRVPLHGRMLKAMKPFHLIVN